MDRRRDARMWASSLILYNGQTVNLWILSILTTDWTASKTGGILESRDFKHVPYIYRNIHFMLNKLTFYCNLILFNFLKKHFIFYYSNI